MPVLVVLIFLACIGACIGSFINVIVWRMPRGESIVFPGSHCIKCNHFLSWFDNIPFISFFLLKGRCRNCGEPISFRYPLIELICALLFLISYFSTPSSYLLGTQWLVIIFSCILASILLSLTILDINYFWLPESICRFGVFCGLLLSFIFSLNLEENSSLFAEHFFASILGYFSFSLLSKVAKKILGKPALGKGDAKLVALIGSWLGFYGLCLTVYLAFIASGILVTIGLFLKRIKFGEYLPFGPFLSICTFLVWSLGNYFWYSKIIAFGNLFLRT